MRKILRGSTYALLSMAIAGCGRYNEPIAPFNPRELQEDERAAAQGAPMRPQRKLPTTLETDFPIDPAATQAARDGRQPATGPAIGSTEPVVRMSLRELVQRTTANNLDVKVAGYAPAIEQTRVTEAEARFDPVFFTNVQYANNYTLSPSVADPFFGATGAANVSRFRSLSGQVGLRQDLESGGRVELRYEPSRSKQTPTNFDPNPFWGSDLVLQVTQPLLRDFGADVNRARIVINRNNQRISLLDFRDTLERNISDLERAYWQLVQGLAEVKIAEELLDRTLSTASILWERRRQDVGRQQLSQANASLETRRTILIRARARVRDLSDQIKRLLNDPEFPVAGPTLILPADEPLKDQILFDLQDQIATAMEYRFELGQQQYRVDNAGVAADVARNNLLPQLALVGSVGVQGLGGTYDESVDDQANFDFIDYAVGLQLEIPIGNRAARAIWRRAQLQRSQAVDQYRALIDQVTLDVRVALREVETTWEERIGSANARFAAADALAAIEERERANEQLTPEFVNRKLDLQAQLAQAQSREAEATSNYMNALAGLERAKGTLLRYNNIVMEESPLDQQTASSR